MKTLNRPMFRYGGPIKEGIMDGMKRKKGWIIVLSLVVLVHEKIHRKTGLSITSNVFISKEQEWHLRPLGQAFAMRQSLQRPNLADRLVKDYLTMGGR
jgi:hypothetical protein